MSCRAWLPFGLLALLTLRVADLWRSGELDPVTLGLLPVAAAMVVWLVRQPGRCGGAECAVDDGPRRADVAGADPSLDVEPSASSEPVATERSHRSTTGGEQVDQVAR